jgi:hypothetical protein
MEYQLFKLIYGKSIGARTHFDNASECHIDRPFAVTVLFLKVATVSAKNSIKRANFC